MPEVDPVTGQPKEISENKKPNEKYERFMAQKLKADQLSDDINSSGGQLVLHKIEEHLLMRVNKLIDEDGECKALKKVLQDMGINLNIGEMAVKGLMRLVAKKQTP